MPSEVILIYIGTGIVAQPNEAGSGTVGVYPQELMADANGNVTDVTDIGGMSQADIITAEFRNTNAYLDGAPLLVEGDVVTLLEHADTGVVYWEPFKRSLIRTVTKISHSYPAKKDANTNDDASNNYRVNLDTEKGELSVVTTRDRDEPVGYTIALETNRGVFTFQVDNGDLFQWDNVAKSLVLMTDRIRVEAKEVLVKADVAIDGNVSITKNLSVKGSTATGGNVNVRGSVAAGKMMRSKLGRFPNLD